MVLPSDGVWTESCMREPSVERRVIHDVVVGVADRVNRVGREGNRRRQVLRRRVRPESLLRPPHDIVPPGEYRVRLRAVCAPGLLAVPAMECLAESRFDRTVLFEGGDESAACVEGRMANLPQRVRFASSVVRDPVVMSGFEGAEHDRDDQLQVVCLRSHPATRSSPSRYRLRRGAPQLMVTLTLPPFGGAREREAAGRPTGAVPSPGAAVATG